MNDQFSAIQIDAMNTGGVNIYFCVSLLVPVCGVCVYFCVCGIKLEC